MTPETVSAGADTPPAVDFRGHLAAVRLRRYPIALAAGAVALAVLAMGLMTPPTYAADATVRVDVPSSDGAPPAEAATFAAQTVIGLAATPDVRITAASGSGLGLTAADAAARTTVTQTEVPGFLTVRATGPTARDAQALADATVVALRARLAGDRTAAVASATAPLRDRLARLDATPLAPDTPERAAAEQQRAALVEAITNAEATPAPNLLAAPADAVAGPVSPTPWRDALLALVVALIVVAEGVVVVRALRGRLSEAEPAAQITRLIGLPAAEADRGPDPATALAPLYRAHLRTAPETPLVVVQLGRPRARDLARDLADAATLAGDAVELRDAGNACAAGVRAVLRLRGRRLDADLVACARDAAGPVVLAVDTVSTGLRRLRSDVLALRAVGIPVAAVVVWRGSPPRERRTDAVCSAPDCGPGSAKHWAKEAASAASGAPADATATEAIPATDRPGTPTVAIPEPTPAEDGATSAVSNGTATSGTATNGTANGAKLPVANGATRKGAAGATANGATSTPMPVQATTPVDVTTPGHAATPEDAVANAG